MAARLYDQNNELSPLIAAPSVEQLSSTVSEAGTNFTSDKRLGKSFYNRVDYVADRIADESEIRRGNSSRTRTWLERFPS